MRIQFLRVIGTCVAIIVAAAGLRFLGAAPAVTGSRLNSLQMVEDGWAGPAASPHDTRKIASAPTGTAAPPEKPEAEGALLLESRCAQCHSPQLLIETKKSRTGWEKALAQMENMGVRLNEQEKMNLLDYLAAPAP